MPIFWVLKDCLLQLETLVTRKVAIEMAEIEDRSPPPPDAKNPLEPLDVDVAMTSLQSWMQKFALEQDLPELCEKFEQINRSHKLDEMAENKQKSPQKQKQPSTHDRALTVDDKRDTSVKFYLLDTLHKIFSAIVGLEGYVKKQDAFLADQGARTVPDRLARTPIRMIEFCYNHLKHENSPAVRTAAANCLGVLSHHFLKEIISYFDDGLTTSHKDADQRAFAAMQKAVGHLEFGVASPEQTELTMNYLNSLYKNMKKVDRGVLRSEICNSLQEVFYKILDPKDDKKKQQWVAFAKSAKQAEDFWELYENIYNTVAKWSSKTKHSMFCYHLLARMVVLSKLTLFYNSKRRMDVFRQLVATMKKDNVRLACLRFLKEYIRDLPQAFIEQDMEAFTLKIKHLISNLFPKKETIPAEEEKSFGELLLEVARRHVHFIVNEVMGEMLKPKSSYSTSQKAVLLRALGIVAREKQEDVATYHYLLGPLIAPFIEEYTQNKEWTMPLHKYIESVAKEHKDDENAILLRAALTCFPHVRHPKMERVQVTATNVGRMTLHADREISALSAMCMQQFVLLNPAQNTIPTLHTFVDLLRDIPLIRPEALLKTCNNIKFLLTSIIEYMNSHKKELKEHGFVSVSAWSTLRQHLEGVSLLWLCHHETWVRAEIIRMLQLFSSKEFRAIERVSENSEFKPTAFLIDALLDEIAIEEKQSRDKEKQGVKEKEAVGVGAKTGPEKAKVDDEGWLTLRGMDGMGSLMAANFGGWGASPYHNYNYAHGGVGGAMGAKDAPPPMAVPSASPAGVSAAAGGAAGAGDADDAPGRRTDGKQGPIAAADPFPSFLRTFLTASYDKFPGVISWAWSQMSDHIGALQLLTPDEFNELSDASDWYQVYRNKLSFLCLAVHSSHVDMKAAPLPAMAKKGTVRRTKSLAEKPQKKKSIIRKNSVVVPKNRLADYVVSVDQILEFFQKVYEILHNPLTATSPEWYGIARHLAAAVGQIHPSSYDVLIRVLRTPLNDDNATRKRVHRDMQATQVLFFYHEFTLEILACFFDRMSPESYHEAPTLLTKSLQELIDVWITNPEEGGVRSQPLRTKRHICSLMAQFIWYRCHDKPHADHMSREDVLNRRDFFFNFFASKSLLTTRKDKNQIVEPNLLSTSRIGRILDVQKDQELSLRGMETVVLKAVTNLLRLGPVNNLNSEDKIIQFLHHMPLRHEYVNKGVSEALEVFLKLNPHRLRDFVLKSFPETHAREDGGGAGTNSMGAQRILGPNHERHSIIISNAQADFVHREAVPTERSFASKISVFYLKAVITNYVSSLESWIHDYAVSPASMLLLSLVHQANPDPHARHYALKLAAALAKRKGGSPYDPGFFIRLYTHRSPVVYIQTTLHYSEALAEQPRYFPSIAIILEESSRLNVFVDDSRKEILLRLMIPWVQQFGPYLAKLHQGGDILEVTAAAKRILLSMFRITRQCHGSSLLNRLLSELWMQLMDHSEHVDLMVPQVVTFLVNEYKAMLLGDVSSVTEVEQEMKGIMGGQEKEKEEIPMETNGDEAPVAGPASRVMSGVPAFTNEGVSGNGSPSGSGNSAQVGKTSSGGAGGAGGPSHRVAASLALGSGSHGAREEDKHDAEHKRVFSDLSGAAAKNKASNILEKLETYRKERLDKDLDESKNRMPPETKRIATESMALLKMIFVFLTRSKCAERLVASMMKELRNYTDNCPTDPDQCVQYMTDKKLMDETVTATERSAFELSINFVFENGPYVKRHIGLLLQNACVLHWNRRAGKEMMTFIELALGVFDYNSRPNDDESKDLTQFMQIMIDTYPELRAAWSQRTFTWAINAADSKIATAALKLFEQLESHAFFFGDGQTVLVRVVLALYWNVRQQQLENASHLMRVLLLPSAHVYDQQGWLALLATGVALMNFRHTEYFRLGLSLISKMVRHESSMQQKREWVQALGNFVLDDGKHSIDAAVAKVAIKGFTSLRTAEETLGVVQAMASYYVGTLPPNNRMLIMLCLANLLLRGLDILRIQKEKSDHVPALQSEEEKHAYELAHVRRVEDCVDLSLLITEFKDADDEENRRTGLWRLSRFFQILALAQARDLPDAEDEGKKEQNDKELTDKQRMAKQRNKCRKDLFNKLVSLLKLNKGSVDEEKAADSEERINDTMMPSVQVLCSHFFRVFHAVFRDQLAFDACVHFFRKLLRFTPYDVSWRKVILRMLGQFLQTFEQSLSEKQFSQLSDLLVQNYYFTDTTILSLTENIAFLMVHKSKIQVKGSFNFLRPRIKPNAANKPVDSEYLTDSSPKRKTIDTARCIRRMEKYTFPLLRFMLDHPRKLERPKRDVDREAVFRKLAEVELEKKITVARPRRISAHNKRSSFNKAAGGPPGGKPAPIQEDHETGADEEDRPEGGDNDGHDKEEDGKEGPRSNAGSAANSPVPANVSIAANSLSMVQPSSPPSGSQSPPPKVVNVLAELTASKSGRAVQIISPRPGDIRNLPPESPASVFGDFKFEDEKRGMVPHHEDGRGSVSVSVSVSNIGGPDGNHPEMLEEDGGISDDDAGGEESVAGGERDVAFYTEEEASKTWNVDLRSLEARASQSKIDADDIDMR